MSEPWIVERLPAPLRKQTCSVGRYKQVCRSLSTALKASERGNFNSYGQGAASFVDAFFYRDKPEFRAEVYDKDEQAFIGLGVQLCLFAPYATLYQNMKSWHAGGGAGGLPCFESVDHFGSRSVLAMANVATEVLEREGVRRLARQELSAELPVDLMVETNLAVGPQRLYDALFYWYD